MDSENRDLRLLLAILLPVVILAAGAFVAFTLFNNPPQAAKRPPQRAQVIPVEATVLQPQSYTVKLRSFGNVAPRVQTTLVTQVAGVVAAVSPNFQPGRRFARGEVLLELDDSNYEIAVRSAEAALVQARAQLTEESARGDQAAADWKKLGKRGTPGALVLRTPQRQAAQAQVQSAQAQLERARLDLARTRVTAPYDGQVLSRSVEQGRFVPSGSALGVVFAADALDVRLPLNSTQLEQMDLGNVGAPIELRSDDSARVHAATLARSEGQIELATRQLFVVAEVDAGADLAVGQFVQASLAGRRYDDVFVLPERLLRPEGDVFLAEDGQVRRAAVELLYNDGVNAVVRGLAAGDVLILTPLGNAVSGTRVAATVDGQAPAARRSSGGSGSPLQGAEAGARSGS